MSVTASLVSARVRPVKAPAVEAVFQVKVEVYSLWPRDRLSLGSIKALHLKALAVMLVVHSSPPEPLFFKNPSVT